MAGVPGFEPRLPDPESGVLPLHHTPKRPDLSIYGIDMTSENYIGYLSIVNPNVVDEGYCHGTTRQGK